MILIHSEMCCRIQAMSNNLLQQLVALHLEKMFFLLFPDFYKIQKTI